MNLNVKTPCATTFLGNCAQRVQYRFRSILWSSLASRPHCAAPLSSVGLRRHTPLVRTTLRLHVATSCGALGKSHFEQRRLAGRASASQERWWVMRWLGTSWMAHVQRRGVSVDRSTGFSWTCIHQNWPERLRADRLAASSVCEGAHLSTGGCATLFIGRGPRDLGCRAGRGDRAVAARRPLYRAHRRGVARPGLPWHLRGRPGGSQGAAPVHYGAYRVGHVPGARGGGAAGIVSARSPRRRRGHRRRLGRRASRRTRLHL